MGVPVCGNLGLGGNDQRLHLSMVERSMASERWGGEDSPPGDPWTNACPTKATLKLAPCEQPEQSGQGVTSRSAGGRCV